MTLTQQTLTEYVGQRLEGTDCFITDVRIGTNGDITVEIDSDSYVDIDFIAALSRDIEAEFAPEIDDYNLEVGSAGLTAPLRLPRQYRKNIGNDLEVLASDGKKYSGRLAEADEEGITLVCSEKVKREGEKRPTIMDVDHRFLYGDIRKAVYELKF